MCIRDRNYNHPSIMFWGLSNEILIGGICQELVDNHHDLQTLVRELDPTRLTTIAHVSKDVYQRQDKSLSDCLISPDEKKQLVPCLLYTSFFLAIGGTVGAGIAGYIIIVFRVHLQVAATGAADRCV